MDSLYGRNEFAYPLSAETYLFIGKKAAAVLFGAERVDVKNWRGVFGLLLNRCNEEHHDDLMYLRNKAAGKVRTFLSDKPDGMVRPFRIDEELYADSGQYGTVTLLHILRDLILTPTRFDWSDIRIVMRNG
jgi:hypothetical protein